VSVLLASLVVGWFVTSDHGAPIALAAAETSATANPSDAASNSVGRTMGSTVPGGQVFERRPFTVVRSTEASEWTAEDCRNTNVIRRLAHNDLEYQRMLDENDRVLRRQLVYRKQTVATFLQSASVSGKSARELALPGLDGQELKFEIIRVELSPSGNQGTLSGHIVGRPDSLVTMAFKQGREAFTVISPSDKTFLQADPREPGELIIKSIDPETYVGGMCGNP
jgi:hypothetical protein